ncbi:hypothetical protein DFQ28_004774 [Apophysomyces sp. BC1034]|nr:hypothetical protein DFQ30_000341 [Apophysomyces sp. BC1015]KAG0178200.1 hypothetical protein DFQ29_003796 [Apophysomyces sp. BC1021]KAG0188484.1 hypothetical protein DFQ28_004774 [Apophysomyces sp. BC1034]
MSSSTSPVIIVTGASRGIGKAVTLLALKNFNARVVAVARSEPLLENLRKEAAKLNKVESLEVVVGDVTDDATARRAVGHAMDKWHQIDAVVANAGVLEPIASIAEGSVQGWRQLFEVNLFSVITLIQQAVPHLRRSKGSIVLVSSGAALKGYQGWGAYGASKAALNHLAETLSVEEPDVTSVAIRPGVVDTEMQGLIREKGHVAMKDDLQKFVDLHREGKLNPPEASGHVIAALAAKASHELSGQFLSWDAEVLKEYRM